MTCENTKDVQAAIKETIEEFGRLDYACNNAGVEQSPEKTAELDETEWDRIVDTDLRGVFLCMKYEIPHILEEDGAIVNISSDSGFRASEGGTAYNRDVTSPTDAESATQAAVDRFGRIDVLVNNADISHKGFFEEMTIEEIKHQLEVNLFGQMYVARAVLPVMCEQRSGHVITISSGAGLDGFPFSSAYAASKFGLEGG